MPVPPVITISSSAASTQGKSASSHRLPTQSAAEALQDIESGSVNAFISSGLSSLDHGLTANSNLPQPGFERGKVAEIWGPPGAGKTSLAFQAATEAIKGNGAVVWLDCATLLSAPKLKLLKPPNTSETVSSHEKLLFECFYYRSMPTLSHLLAQVIHPSPTFPPPKTSLLVIDGLNTLLDLDFPRLGYSSSSRTDTQKWQSNRRYGILGTLISALSKSAILYNLAVLVTTGCNSKMRTGIGAAIGPGVGGSEWEAGTHTRVVVFCDFNGRYVGVQKVNGRNLMPLDPMSDVSNVIEFEIERDGSLKETVVDLTSSPMGGGPVSVQKTGPAPPQAPTRKRIHDEIADSEDEDVDEYGWAEQDDEDVIVIDPVVVNGAGKDAGEKQLVEEQTTEEHTIEEASTTQIDS